MTDRELLLDIVARLERMERVGEQQRAGVCRADRAVLARLLPAAAGVFGSELFLSADLVEHESAALRVVTAGMSVRQVGRLLKRAAGVEVDGFVVQREGAEAGVALWRILKVPGFPREQNSFVPRGVRGQSLP